MVNVVFGPVVQLLTMSELEVDAAKGIATGFLFNVVVGYCLTIVMGPLGAAIALLVSFFVSGGLMWNSSIRKLGINTCPLAFWVRAA